MNLTFSLICLCCLGLAVAQFSPDELTNLVIKDQVKETQFHYNRHFDACIAIGSVNSHESQVYQQALNAVMTAFCPVGFISWRAYFEGEVATEVTNLVALRQTYDALCGTNTGFINVSRHVITNEIVTPYYQGNQVYAQFNSSITQFNFQNFGAGPVWNMNLGWYDNTWKFENDIWCMTQFIAMTDNIELWNVTSVGQTFDPSQL
jgi:hypothetical protein